MMRIRKCRECKAYTLKEFHCTSLTGSAHPAKFNPNDRHAAERRKAKGLYSS